MGIIITDTAAAHNGDADAAASQCVKKYLSFNPGQILPEWAKMYYPGIQPHIMVNNLLILPSLCCTRNRISTLDAKEGLCMYAKKDASASMVAGFNSRNIIR